AEDGIRDFHVTGVQTCALPIYGKTYQYKFYSLSAIIAVGYRTNSQRALQFRQWATKVLDTFTKQGYVLDKNRLINGQIFDEDYRSEERRVGKECSTRCWSWNLI